MDEILAIDTVIDILERKIIKHEGNPEEIRKVQEFLISLAKEKKHG